MQRETHIYHGTHQTFQILYKIPLCEQQPKDTGKITTPVFQQFNTHNIVNTLKTDLYLTLLTENYWKQVIKAETKSIIATNKNKLFLP